MTQSIPNNSNDDNNKSIESKEADGTNDFRFQPYDNDHQSLQIGQLIFENQTDKVTVYGDIDISKDKQGLSQALKLQKLFNLIVSELQAADSAQQLPETIDVPSKSTEEIDNPFS